MFGGWNKSEGVSSAAGRRRCCPLTGRPQFSEFLPAGRCTGCWAVPRLLRSIPVVTRDRIGEEHIFYLRTAPDVVYHERTPGGA